MAIDTTVESGRLTNTATPSNTTATTGGISHGRRERTSLPGDVVDSGRDGGDSGSNDRGDG
jgi:hypothetical protein